MYGPLLTMHSLLRWVVLALVLAVVVRSLVGWLRQLPFGPLDRRLGLFSTIAVDLQLVVGLLLYGVFSPLTNGIFANFGGAMGNRVLRFWALEHVTLGLLCVIAVHIGRVVVRRADLERQRHKRTAVAMLIALVLVVAAIPWPFLATGRPLFRF